MGTKRRLIFLRKSQHLMYQVVTRENGQFLSKYYKYRFVGITQIWSFGTPNFDKFRTFVAKTWTHDGFSRFEVETLKIPAICKTDFKKKLGHVSTSEFPNRFDTHFGHLGLSV